MKGELLMGLIVVGLFLGTVALGMASAANACSDTGHMTGRRTVYSFWSGCYVEVNGKLIPSERWREVDTE